MIAASVTIFNALDPLSLSPLIVVREWGCWNSVQSKLKCGTSSKPLLAAKKRKKKLGKKSGQDLTGGARSAIRLGRQAGR